MPENIILTGFMGSGKTAAGKTLARNLNRTFVDMDDLLIERAGKTIEQVFAEEGETVFRQLEAEVCRDIGQMDSLVVATGGGAVVEPTNRQHLEENGILICLTAAPETVLERVLQEDNPVRPLLAGSDPQTKIVKLLQERQPAYDAVQWQVDTNQKSVREVVENIKNILEALRLPVSHPNGEYPIQIGNGLIDHAGDLLRQLGTPAGSKIAVVSNNVVAPLYGERIIQALQKRGYTPVLCEIPDGEQNKTLQTVSDLYNQFLENGVQRGDSVLALGGGVTGDIAGFCAATYLRGVQFIQAPTTLLAMVDSSVGGKTGVDLPQGKNLIGAFKQPELVLIDPQVLKTLPVEEIRAGLAEVIKHGIISNPDLFNQIEKISGDEGALWEPSTGSRLVAKAVQVKIDVVEQDPYEKGLRAVLNLGHTTGHALEMLSHYQLRHGEGVGIGMVTAARIAQRMEICTSETASKIETILTKWELPTRCPPFAVGYIIKAMSHDKKKTGKIQRWILPHRIGKTAIHEDVDQEIVKKVLLEIGAVE